MSTRSRPGSSPHPTPWRWAAGVILGLTALGIVGVWRSATAGDASAGAPHLMVDRSAIDLGDLPFDARVTAVFTLMNVGHGVLNILEDPPVTVVAGCCPPKAVVGQTAIEPGQSTTLTLAFSRQQGMGGVHVFDVRLRTNDPVVPEWPLTVRSFWGPR
jgi:hypothetical protein